jgi:signal transduction histidine kinase/PAS domain-containing protein
MSDMVVSSSKNIMLTFRKPANGLGEELIYLSSNTQWLGKGRTDSENLHFIESRFPTLEGEFFERVFDELTQQKKLIVPILIDEYQFQFAAIEGCVIKQDQGDYLVNSLICPIEFSNETLAVWLIDTQGNCIWNAPHNGKSIKTIDEWKHFVGEKFDYLDTKSIKDFHEGEEDVAITLFPGHLFMTKKKLCATHCLVEISYAETNNSQEIPQSNITRCYYEYDKQQQRYLWGKGMKELLGYEEAFFEQMTSESWKSIIHPEDVHLFQIGLGHSFKMVYRVLHAKGNYLFIKDEFQQVSQKTGIKTLGSISNITDLKKVENDILQIKTVLDGLTDVMPGMVYLLKMNTDLTHKFIFVSEGSKQLLGITGDLIIEDENNLINLIHPEDLDDLFERDRYAYLNDTKFECYFRIITPSGTIKWIYGASNRLEQYAKDSIWAGVFVDVTISKQKEEEANFLMKKYKLIFDENPLPMFQYSKDGIIKDVNKSFIEKIDISDPNLLIGKNLFDLVGENPIKEAYQNSISQGFGFYEGPYISHFNNKLFHLRAIAKPIDGGENFQAILEDISEQEYVHNIISKLTEKTSKYSGQGFFDQLTHFFSVQQNMSNCLIAEFDASKNLANVISYHSNGIKKPNFSYILKNTPCSECLETKQPVIIANDAYKKYPFDEYLVANKINSYLAVPIRDPEGNQLGLLIMFDEKRQFLGSGKKELLNVLSDRVGAELNRLYFENKLIESELLFRSIAVNFPKGIIEVLDSQFNYVYTEGKEYQSIGVNPSVLIGTPHLSTYDTATAEIVKNQLINILNGDSVIFEVSIQGQQYLKSGVPLFSKTGIIDKILLVTQNITETKKSEEEREQLIKDLKSQNEELQRFAYIISHNLRAPIVNITSLLELYNTENPSDIENTEIIGNLKISTNILNDTLKDLIEVVSIKKNKIPKVEPILFEEITQRIFTSLAKQIKESNAVIVKDFKACPSINYIYSHLENFLINLTTNALKYKHPSRDPQITIRTFKNEDGMVILEFSDNGIGIDLKRYGDRLFGLYQRFHSHVEGKGLGLYLVREQIRAHDGQLSIRSVVGEGTSFEISLKNMKFTMPVALLN